MKYFITLITLVSLCGCKTDHSMEFGELSVKGQYCKYPDNDFLGLPFQLFQDETHIINDTIEFTRESKITGLPFGKYSIKYTSIYDIEETIQFELTSKNQEVKLCIDHLNYKQHQNKLFVDQLNPNEKLKIDFRSNGCFHFETSELEIIKMDKHYVAKMDKTQIVLTQEQLELIREFEIELKEIKSGYCTTSDTYNLTIIGTVEGFELVDDGCHWNGYDNLLKKLGFKNNYS